MRGLFALGLRYGLAALLASASLLKLSRFGRVVDSLAALGVTSRRLRFVAVGGAAAVELALAVAVASGSSIAAYSAAGLMVIFAALHLLALATGRGGLPCPCLGARGRVGPAAVARNLLLAAAFAAIPFAAGVELSTVAWLGIGLAVSLAGVAALTIAVLALAREVGLLRLRLPPEAALELLSEGPELGRFAPIVDRFPVAEDTRLALAVFSSRGCRMCRALEPAVTSLAGLPGLSVRVFDEEADRDAWDELGVPGSPYAVAIDLDGTVRAKGTFNSLAQLESVVATAQRRAAAHA